MIEMIEFKNLSFSYDKTLTVFKDASCAVPMNCNVLVDGVSGTGRSTFLKILAGLALPSSGSYLINDKDTCQMSFEEFLPYRKKIGYSFDFGGLFANRTLFDNLMLPLLYHNEVSYKEASERVTELMHRFNIWEGRDRRPASVSGGMRKTCVVVRAFVMRPEMILMDDPFVALDPGSIDEVLRLVAEMRKDGSLKHLFLTTREMSWAEKLDCTIVNIENYGVVTNVNSKGLKKVASL